MQPQYDVIILGAGAAGLMCAIEAGKRGRRTLVLDKARKAGRKILISGGGRCNFTNLFAEPGAYLSQNPHFCKSALSRFTQWDFIALMDKHGVKWHEKTLGQLFCDNKAVDVVEMLLAECTQAGVEFRFNCEIDSVSHDGAFHVATQLGDFTAAALVVATGGLSIPRMGSTDLGHKIAKQFGHRIEPTSPALVPFTFHQHDLDRLFKDLSGISLPAIVSCNGQQFAENILITHRGISGPAILQISSYWKRGDSIHINLLPGQDAESLLKTARQQQPRIELKTWLGEFFPKRFAQRLCELLNENPQLANLSDIQIERISTLLNDWTLQPSGTEGYRTAEVTLGGVDTADLSSKTMESRKQAGLYFIGEVVDVTGWLGGYNFQWAWASGWVAGQYV